MSTKKNADLKITQQFSLNQCPYCLSTPMWDEMANGDGNGTRHYLVTCPDCGTTGPNWPARSQAADGWNRLYASDTVTGQLHHDVEILKRENSQLQADLAKAQLELRELAHLRGFKEGALLVREWMEERRS